MQFHPLRSLDILANIYLLKVSNRKTRKKEWNMFTVNNKNTRPTSMTSFWCFYCWFWTYLVPFSSASIIDFEQVNISWDRLCWIFLTGFQHSKVESMIQKSVDRGILKNIYQPFWINIFSIVFSLLNSDWVCL